MTLVIEGDLAQAQTNPQGRSMLAIVRRSLVTGGRAFLTGAGGSYLHGFGAPSPVTIRLDPVIARRLYTSGAELTEEEIAAGMAQLRVSDEDVARATYEATEDAVIKGIAYARDQFDIAIMEGDERALHQAWEMCRKVNGLRKRLKAMDEGRGE